MNGDWLEVVVKVGCVVGCVFNGAMFIAGIAAGEPDINYLLLALLWVVVLSSRMALTRYQRSAVAWKRASDRYERLWLAERGRR